MVDIYIGGRCSYKTTMCINYLKEHPDAVLFVGHYSMINRFPEDVKDRVYSITEGNICSHQYKEVIIDELDCCKNFDIVNALLYYLESNNALVFVTATPFLSYNKKDTPLRQLIRTNKGYKILLPKMDSKVLDMLKASVTDEVFWRDAFGYMKTDEELDRLNAMNNEAKRLKDDLERIHNMVDSMRMSAVFVERITDKMLNE